MNNLKERIDRRLAFDFDLACDAGKKGMDFIHGAKWQNALTTSGLSEVMADVVGALWMRIHHDEDCADATEKFKPQEMCECGASWVADALMNFEKWVEKK